MSDYEKLQEQFSKDIFDNADAEEKEIYKTQKKNLDELLNLIAKTMLSFTIVDTILSLGEREKQSVRGKFITTIASMVKAEFDGEKDLMDSLLSEVTKDKYYTDAYTFLIDFDFKLKRLTEEQIKNVVNSTIKGEIWSDRLWSNKKALEKTLVQEVEKFLQGTTNVNKIEKVIKDKFNQNAYNSHRLVQTEVAKCQSEANEVFAKEHGVQWQMFMATLDNKTSEICQRNDGKKFRIDDESKPVPPLHPNCRSVLINLPSEDWMPKTRKDNKTKETINYTTYEQWAKENNIK